MSITIDIEQHVLRQLRHKSCGFTLQKVLVKHEWWLVCTSCVPKRSWKVVDIRQGKAQDLILLD